MNYDGSDFENLVYYEEGGYSEGISVDQENELLYWASSSDYKLYRSNLDGSNITPIKEVPVNFYLADIEVDAANNRIFYSS